MSLNAPYENPNFLTQSYSNDDKHLDLVRHVLKYILISQYVLSPEQAVFHTPSTCLDRNPKDRKATLKHLTPFIKQFSPSSYKPLRNIVQEECRALDTFQKYPPIIWRRYYDQSTGAGYRFEALQASHSTDLTHPHSHELSLPTRQSLAKYHRHIHDFALLVHTDKAASLL